MKPKDIETTAQDPLTDEALRIVEHKERGRPQAAEMTRVLDSREYWKDEALRLHKETDKLRGQVLAVVDRLLTRANASPTMSAWSYQETIALLREIAEAR